MEQIKHSDIKTLEDYKLYQRQKSRRWYLKNREKKKKYQLDRYYKSKEQLLANQ